MRRVNESDLAWTTTEEASARFKRKRLADAAGGERLGCSLYELAPGDRSWPYHYHTGNEEALYVLAGRGRVRHAGGETGIESGDYVALPADESGGHRIVNDGDAPLRYLAVSTMNDPDVLVYPDSGKVGVFAGAPPGGSGERTVHGYFRTADAVDYWEGEAGGDAERRRDDADDDANHDGANAGTDGTNTGTDQAGASDPRRGSSGEPTGRR